jgi:hypothetical protein
MSLDYNYGKVNNWQELHSDDRQWSITEHLIWHTMAVQMSAITEKNWRQFAVRYFAWHELHSTSDKGKVSVADIKRRIGLVTNAPNRTDAQFRKFLADKLMDEGKQVLWKDDDAGLVC